MLYVDDAKKGRAKGVEVGERLRWMLICRDLNRFFGTHYGPDDLMDMDATFLDDLMQAAEVMGRG